MHLIRFQTPEGPSYGARLGDEVIDLRRANPALPNDLTGLLALGDSGLTQAQKAIEQAESRAVHLYQDLHFLPPIAQPEKIICIGLNYADHVKETPTPMEVPSYPVLFLRTARSLIAHQQPLIRPLCSEQFDFEGELVCVIGKAGRHIPKERALEHVAGWSLFNDASVRDYQFKSPQWTVGKNFDGTGSFGPELVTADELPPGAVGLTLTTTLNGREVQRASTNDMIFDVATQISVISQAMTLVPGDIIVTGTPSGVGIGRKPPLWMKHGDVCTVSFEGISTLSNPVIDESAPTAR